MAIPNYKHFRFKNTSREYLGQILNQNINLKHPVVFNLSALKLEEQKEMIRYIEDFFQRNDISPKYPYPVYFISKDDVSGEKIPTVVNERKLPIFFQKKDSRINLKESQQLIKNKLIQQQIKNYEASSFEKKIREFATKHREIYELERERKAYLFVYEELTKNLREES